MRTLSLFASAFLFFVAGAAAASPSLTQRNIAESVLSEVERATPVQRRCRRVPIWGFRISPFCKPSGICNDRVIKGYRTVCN
ncbi:MAG: hypothetical protein F9K44_04650 [Hyphomicrobiaceae bacterium]|nr:MAG: hypothetical protein F9K44_04650 [Hyphomicrobiaceae bacterium]